MPLKPIKHDYDGTFGVAMFENNGTYLGPSHFFSGKDYKSEANAQRAIDRLNKKMGW
jgi:uncharacterized protein YegP (UPF0339 family)